MHASVVFPSCHGTPSLPLLHPPLAASDPICLHSTPSASTLLQLQSILVQLMQLCHTHSWTNHKSIPDLVPTPRATIYIPFLHLSYLPDPFSLTIMGNYSFLFNSFLHVTHPLYIAGLEQNEKTAFFSFLLR